MPHKSKKDKESSKSGRSKKSGSKNGPADDHEGSNKKVPPATQLMRVKQPGSHSAMKREKRFSTSSFPLSANRELQKLPALAANRPPSLPTAFALIAPEQPELGQSVGSFTAYITN
ncbi:serine/threonine-protein phosphatase 2A 56 kDa regulatory subunit delta isoform-like [Seriola lalandi dorsalis]|uniref:serine/threonine-protein phosphatase 2A 56 kDa regulatory subunit delta isoform-like n=1 Tax=Seriola lalandi dorsalis TaxID=1841481 RepID=UPI000C6F7B08|nr:serine/threonine-protein phosphatase 2A 56 kDa regulatory subunit delta isoform-like [Seriola lalandi dorsalis]